MFNSLRIKGKILWDVIKPRNRLGLLSAVFVVSALLVLIFVVGPQAYASSIGDDIASMIGELFLWIATKLLSLTVFLLKFVIEIASYNNYINSGAVTLGWILVRDVTNMFFVIILMVIAFGTVLGIEQYEWKKLLVKFVMAAILVNFSRVICGVIIDAAQVFMMTFISGVAAVAGGNLINALKLESILSYSKNTSAEAMKHMNVVVTSMFACVFAFATVVVMGAYLVVLIGRAITLWVLIILSPLSFVLSVIPKTQQYASQWWSEFSNNVIVGPVLAFFLWLAFAVAGGSDVHQEFSSGSAYPMTDPASEQAAIEAMGAQSATESSGTNLSAVMEWDNMASFIIAVGLLLAGVKTAQKLGTAGAGALGAAGGAVTGFAMAATGVTAARWAARTGVGAAKRGAMKAGKFVAMKAPVVGGDAWKRRGRSIKAGVAEKYQDVMRGYEGATNKLRKGKGWRRALGSVAPLTSFQKEKDVQFRESMAKVAKEEREELHGRGGTELGKRAGRRKKHLEHVIEEEDFNKKAGLMLAEADAYKRVGKNEMAQKIYNDRDAMIYDRKMKQDVAHMDYPQLMGAAEAGAQATADIKKKIVEEYGKGDKADKSKIDGYSEKLNEQQLHNTRLLAHARGMGGATATDVNKMLSSFSGQDDTDHSAAAEASRVYGLDANKENEKKILEDLVKKFGNSGQNQAAMSALAKANAALIKTDATKIGAAASISEGVVIDERTGVRNVVRGFGRGVGDFDIKGKNRKEEYERLDEKENLALLSGDIEKAEKLGIEKKEHESNSFETSEAKAKYFSEVAAVSYRESTDANSIVSSAKRDSQGNITDVVKFDDRQLESMSRYLGATPATQMKKAFPPSMIEALNKMAMSGENAAFLLKRLSSKMTDDNQIKALTSLLGGIAGKRPAQEAQTTPGGKAQAARAATEESDEIEAEEDAKFNKK